MASTRIVLGLGIAITAAGFLLHSIHLGFLGVFLVGLMLFEMAGERHS